MRCLETKARWAVQRRDHGGTLLLGSRIRGEGRGQAREGPPCAGKREQCGTWLSISQHQEKLSPRLRPHGDSSSHLLWAVPGLREYLSSLPLCLCLSSRRGTLRAMGFGQADDLVLEDNDIIATGNRFTWLGMENKFPFLSHILFSKQEE